MATWTRRRLIFKEPATTSREVMTYRDTYYIDHQGRTGECGLFRGLSCDDRPGYEEKLTEICRLLEEDPEAVEASLEDWPSIGMGVYTLLHLPTKLTGAVDIPINGLVWMGNREEMFRRIQAKLSDGFRCIKLKIGGIDFEEELGLLRFIRERFNRRELELRLDANGSFSPENALERLERLSEFHIHSLEQPIRAGQWEKMREVCENSPIPIALDEELIGVKNRGELLDAVRPAYVILKPTLVGFAGADEWIREAGMRGIGWWATSALESNVGLSAIARWVASKNTTMPQGLGTGELYTNNVPSPLPLRRRGQIITVG